MADPHRNSIATNNCNASKGNRNLDPGRFELFHGRFASGKKENAGKEENRGT